MTDKVLITGGAGFIGQEVAKKMVGMGYEVHLVDNFARGVDDHALTDLRCRPEVVLQKLDLLASEATDSLPHDINYVVHLAAILGVDNVLKQPYQTLRDNVSMQIAIVDYAKTLPNLKKFVFASTSEVYAGSLIHLALPLPTPETVPLALTEIQEPRTSYMLSKVYGESLLVHSGMPYLILRPHNIYGPRMGMSHVIPQLLKKAHDASDGGRIEVASVDHRRTFCFIADAVEMLVSATINPGAQYMTLNLGKQSPEISIGELADMVIKTVGKRLDIKPLPPTPGSPTRRAPDMTKMSEVAGVTAGTTLDDGLQKTYEWYKDNF